MTPATPPTSLPATNDLHLRRELGAFGATMMGLGSILGTGVFVSIAIAAGIAGPAVVIAIALAALVATCNALNSAQLAASLPVSGGTYAYGYAYLRPWLGFAAGWMFLCAKSASAATAALGFAGYVLNALGHGEHATALRVGVAAGTVLLLTAIVLGGVRQSNRVNVAIVSVTVLALATFVVAGALLAWSAGRENLTNLDHTAAATDFWPSLLQATALMFVAFTGYGRIATLGEELRDPRRTIPRAIVVTLWSSATLYVAVALVAVAAVGAGALGSMTTAEAPLEQVARRFALPGAGWIVSTGAMAAMLGVLLNLILGLSRVLLAMGRRGDMPVAVSRLNADRTTPYVAVAVVGAIVLALTLIGNVRTTWSFSAFTVLIYYAITNLAALRLPDENRLYPKWIAWVGLVACLFLAFWVERNVWLAGLGLLAVGLIWHRVATRLPRGSAP